MNHRWFLWAILFECSLLGLAAALSFLLNQPLWADFHWNLRHMLIGALTALPPFVSFRFLLKTSSPWWNDIRTFLEETIRPVFGKWNLGQLALISLSAGVCEEVLFRALLQSWLADGLGILPAWFISSFIFGLLHWITWSYLWFATFMGLYLGGVWLATGNLLVPILAHALYDFLALVYFLKKSGRETNETK
jgi:uncharacterized protein